MIIAKVFKGYNFNNILYENLERYLRYSEDEFEDIKFRNTDIGKICSCLKLKGLNFDSYLMDIVEEIYDVMKINNSESNDIFDFNKKLFSNNKLYRTIIYVTLKTTAILSIDDIIINGYYEYNGNFYIVDDFKLTKIKNGNWGLTIDYRSLKGNIPYSMDIETFKHKFKSNNYENRN